MSITTPPVIALTGGIGSGKTEAAKQFAILGVPVVDTDVIARQLTAVGAPLVAEIRRIFGDEFLTATGELDRTKLRKHVFENKVERLKLEALMHPAIYTEAIKQLHENEKKLQPAYQILVVPLFFENNRYKTVVDQVLLIDCDEAMQIERAMARSHLTATEVKAMMDAQTDRSTRLARADEVIENNASLASFIKKIAAIHKKLIKTCIVSQ
jgi:dephospho-CoA kinase